MNELRTDFQFLEMQISDRRQEVEDYLFHVDVHISNPVVCLTQVSSET